MKDRAALGIIRDAEAKGQLEPGGIIVEGTAGNTVSDSLWWATPAATGRSS